MSVLETLRRDPHHFEFFEALRRLECFHWEHPRLGRSRRAAEDPVRIGQQPSMTFAPSTLASFGATKNGSVERLAVYYLGLFGPNGPLPIHLTEYARNREHNFDDPTFLRFADVFHHRILSLYYRAWADSRPTVHFDRHAIPDRDGRPEEADRFAIYVGALLGMGMESLRGRDALPDLARLYYAGPFSCQSRHAGGLEASLADYFGMPVEIREFVGQWLDVPEQSRWFLGRSPDTGSLGMTTIVGSHVWDCQQKFRIVFGPLTLEEYRRMLPSSNSCRRLAALVRTYIGDELDWDVNLILRRDDVPPLKLGGEDRLGWTTWLTTRTPESDLDSLILSPSSSTAVPEKEPVHG